MSESIASYKRNTPQKIDPLWYSIPFPVLFYKVDKNKDLHTTMDLVDTMNIAAMVIPTSINVKASIESDKITRSRISFFAISYEFLCRDKWEDLDLQRSKAAADSVEGTLLKYERSLKEERKIMLETIKNYAFPPQLAAQEQNEDDDEVDIYDDDNDDESSSESETTNSESDDEDITADMLLQAYNTRSSRRDIN